MITKSNLEREQKNTDWVDDLRTPKIQDYLGRL